MHNHVGMLQTMEKREHERIESVHRSHSVTKQVSEASIKIKSSLIEHFFKMPEFLFSFSSFRDNLYCSTPRSYFSNSLTSVPSTFIAPYHSVQVKQLVVAVLVSTAVLHLLDTAQTSKSKDLDEILTTAFVRLYLLKLLSQLFFPMK